MTNLHTPLMWQYDKTKRGETNTLLCTNPKYLKETGVSNVIPLFTQEEINKAMKESL